MPANLAVDSMGRIYSTSGDRADGLGFGSYPTSCNQTDVTLGASYLKAQSKRTRELLNRKRNQQILDKKEKMMGAARREHLKREQHKNMAQHRMMQNPQVKEAVMKRGLQMGCSCVNKGTQGDNILTANGLSGFAGMSRDQQVIHSTVLGIGSTQAPPADRTLVRQAQARQQADRFLRIKAVPAVSTGKTRLY